MRRQITEDELLVFYAAIGKGIWMLQNVEDALHVYVVLKTKVEHEKGDALNLPQFNGHF